MVKSVHRTQPERLARSHFRPAFSAVRQSSVEIQRLSDLQFAVGNIRLAEILSWRAAALRGGSRL